MAHEKAIKRFGVRYGRTVKRNFSKIEALQRSLHTCPYCRAVKVKRIAVGIWECKKCTNKFTGKAYSPSKVKTPQMLDKMEEQAEIIEAQTEVLEQGEVGE